MTERNVLVQNVSNATVVLSFQNANFTRELRGDGAKTYVPFNILEIGISEPGVDVLFNEGYLYIPDKQDRIDLHLEFEEDEATEQEKRVMDKKDMLALLRRGDAVEIKTTLENLAIEQRNKLAEVAIDNKITGYGICKLIKDYTDVDVMKAVKEAEEDSQE